MKRIKLEKRGIYVIPDFLTTGECEEYRKLVRIPPKGASAFTDTGLFTNKKWVDEGLATKLYERLQGFIEPSPLALRANNIIMTGNYGPGQQFNLHTDTGLFYDRVAKEKSRWTLLIYLNDDFVGGHTHFYDDDWVKREEISPRKCSALLFDIDIWHRGASLEEGEKDWIGIEVIGCLETAARVPPYSAVSDI